MEPKTDQLQTFALAFGLSSFGGLAAFLRSKQPITWRALLSALIYSGMLGLAIALTWFNYFEGQKNIPFLLGVSVFAGIGGVTVFDFLFQIFKNGGINVIIRPTDGDENTPHQPSDQPSDSP